MNNNEIKKMADLENNYWWHQGKIYLIETLVQRYFPEKEDLQILEIGCGTGGLTKHLVKYGKVTGFDISEDAIEYCKSAGLKDVFVQDMNTFNPQNYQEKYDLVLALDVLEHIQDDVGAMKKVYQILKNNGLFIINVPAHKFLWSEHDEALEHKRRYHSLELTRKLKDSSFQILHKGHFVYFVAPIIILYRAWGNIFGKSAYPRTTYVLLPDFFNTIMVKILKIEAKLFNTFTMPFGVTLSVVAKKSIDMQTTS